MIGPLRHLPSVGTVGTANARTKVYITVDSECAPECVVGSTLQPAMGYDLRVWGRLDNQERELGINFIMTELDRYDLKAVFFVEPFAGHTFGAAGLAEICEAILSRGHDVQLHAHPSLRHANWISAGLPRVADDMTAYDRPQQAELLREGIDLLSAAGVRRDRLVSFRAGNFAANNDTWGAMADVGLPISSSYNLGYGHKSLFSWGRPESGLFRAEAGIWELPASSFRERGGGYRHLQIKAVSLSEIIRFLWQARLAGVGHVTVFTHSFEFLHIDSIAKRRGRPNTLTQRRLRGLCRFLRAHADQFEVDTTLALSRRLHDDDAAPSVPVPPGNLRSRIARFVEQAYQRVQMRFPVP